MSRKVIVLAPDIPLLLSDYHNANGVITGIVMNGGWDFKHMHGQCFALDGTGGVRRSWPSEIVREVDVPDDMAGDYNEIIAWAEKEVVRCKQNSDTVTYSVFSCVSA